MKKLIKERIGSFEASELFPSDMMTEADFFKHISNTFYNSDIIPEDTVYMQVEHYGYDGAFDIKCYSEREETDKEYEARIAKEQAKAEKEAQRKLSRQDKALKKLLETFESEEEIMDVFKRLANK